MKRLIFAGLACQICVFPALAQNAGTEPSTAPPPATSAMTPTTAGTVPQPTTGSVDSLAQGGGVKAQGGATPGANSFTESQARSRLEKNGYSQVSELKKDHDGIWRGSAMKDGSSVQVSVDYKGEVAAN
jgi:protein CpxP